MVHSAVRRRCFVASWFALGALVWVLPLVCFVHSRLTNHLPDDYAQRPSYYSNRGNNYNDDLGWGSYFGQQDDDDVRWKNYRDNNCSWLFGCEYQAHARAQAPKWWIGSDETAESSAPLRAALSLVYIGSSVMFAGIVYFGYQASLLVRYEQYYNLDPILPVLLVFAFFSLLVMVLIGCVGGMVDTAGKEFLQHGWFGQIGVLLFVTAFLWIAFSVLFMVLIKTKMFVDAGAYRSMLHCA